MHKCDAIARHRPRKVISWSCCSSAISTESFTTTYIEHCSAGSNSILAQFRKITIISSIHTTVSAAANCDCVRSSAHKSGPVNRKQRNSLEKLFHKHRLCQISNFKYEKNRSSNEVNDKKTTQKHWSASELDADANTTKLISSFNWTTPSSRMDFSGRRVSNQQKFLLIESVRVFFYELHMCGCCICVSCGQWDERQKTSI